MTPASPNTYVVTREPSASEGFTREPVVGYAYTAGKAPTVITLDGERRLIDSAVLFPCGLVVDPINGHTFADVEEWIEFTPKRRPVAGQDKSQKVEQEPDEEEAATPDGYDIDWVKSTFKNGTFWHYDDGEFEFCFTLPGGSDEAPKQTEKVKKIKRTDLDALKKTIDVLDLEEVKNPSILPNADEEGGEEQEDEEEGGLI